TITAMADSAHDNVTQNASRPTMATGRYSQCQPKYEGGSTIASRMPSELKRPSSAAQTNLIGTKSMGKTALRRMAALCLTDGVLDEIASLKPRNGMRPAKMNST